MIGPGTGVRVYLACGVTDMRKGIGGLAALAQDQLAPEAGRRCGVCVPRSAWRQIEALVLGRPRLLPLLQGAGTRALSLAKRQGRDCASDIGAVGHVMGRN